ncbi:hypothetical protein FNH09_02085 [Streptomyces adustus]|uniref:Uncharacterized protein n=1 Tax=Streptomyces adustus TaxID=1609272 RepID=A0A5N8V4R0_9ACTN|nr:hypothetical protein [Streptomyces adustus]MPY30147.1 hypothetical protein [Streptomyces adustus]
MPWDVLTLDGTGFVLEQRKLGRSACRKGELARGMTLRTLVRLLPIVWGTAVFAAEQNSRGTEKPDAENSWHNSSKYFETDDASAYACQGC